jgi:hypothetical protein
MNVLIVTRKGDTEVVVTSEDREKLKAYADFSDGAGSLTWQTFWAGVEGAHSENDGEKSYEIRHSLSLDSIGNS